MTMLTPICRWTRSCALLILLAAVVLPLAGCGKKSPLDLPPGGNEDAPYPRPYPTH